MASWDHELSDYNKWVIKKRIERANRIWAARRFGSWIIAIGLLISFFMALGRI